MADFIKSSGFPEYQETFRENYIDGKRLLKLSRCKDLKINRLRPFFETAEQRGPWENAAKSAELKVDECAPLKRSRVS